MTWLLKLYPPRWRRRYGKEFLALIAPQRFSIVTVLDIIGGAIDEPPVVAASLSDEVMRALEALPVEFRAVLERVIIEGLSYREAADALGCPIGTVMSRLHRARAAMVAELAPDAVVAKAEPRPAQARRRPRSRTEKAEVFGGFVTRRAA